MKSKTKIKKQLQKKTNLELIGTITVAKKMRIGKELLRFFLVRERIGQI